VSSNKLDQLRDLFRTYGSCVVAYSGGVDSVFLARVARDVLGDRALAVIADSPSLPRRELAEALELAERFGIPVRIVQTKEFDNPEYVANPANRCYHCKHELFTELEPIARESGLAVIVYGENASDVGDHRPGAQAAREFRVRAPLKELGFTKEEIRECSASLGLPTADKPQMACLSSRIPYGEVVTPAKLRMIEAAEGLLRELGFHDVRVRHHELRAGVSGAERESALASSSSGREGLSALHLARIELAPSEMPKLLGNGAAARLGEAIRGLGYAHVTLDLLGYRRGSLNEQIQFRSRPAAQAPSAP
jgi:pyridinium-3,5-biscarboxylic acid mononucleotide sulfurtransferase